MLGSGIVIVDYGMGNLRSVQKAFERVGSSATISSDHAVIRQAAKIVLPGVGAFMDGMKNLHDLGMVELLRDEVLVGKKPFLGICLGMQLLARLSYENGETDGLGWIDAEVVRFDFEDCKQKLKVPHVGWNNINFKNHNLLLDGVVNGSDFYFVHSYYFKTNEDVVTSTTSYGFDFVSSLCKNNIYAFQFHPEKSQSVGLKLIENFVNL